jgi:hypothetical protein
MKKTLGLSAAFIGALILADASRAQPGGKGGGGASQSSSSRRPSSSRGNITSRSSRGSFLNRPADGQGKGPMSEAQQEALRSFTKQESISDPQRSAIDRLRTGENLTDEDRTVLTNMLASDPKLDPELREIVKQGLQEDLENKRKPAFRQTQRYLKIKNETNETLTVFVQYRTQVNGEQWLWLPADPKKSADAVPLQVPPGKEIYAEVDKNRILCSRARLWAKASSKGTEWLEYKDQDLWLVPEVDKENPREHVYFAPEAQTFRFVFKS